MWIYLQKFTTECIQLRPSVSADDIWKVAIKIQPQEKSKEKKELAHHQEPRVEPEKLEKITTLLASQIL